MIRKATLSIKNVSKVMMTKPKTSQKQSLGGLSFIVQQQTASLTTQVQYSSSTQKSIHTQAQNISQTNALQSMQLIEQFITSTQFKKHFNSYFYLQKYSWLCIHTWILLYRIRQCQKFSEIVNGYLLKKKILKLLEEYTREQVYEYDDIFDRQIYEQLKRVQQVIFWSLDQYFVFGIREKGLGQIIEEDFSLFWDVKQTQPKQSENPQDKQSQLFEGLNQLHSQPQYTWQRQQQMKKVAQYFLSKLQTIQNLQFDKIQKGDIKQWLNLTTSN